MKKLVFLTMFLFSSIISFADDIYVGNDPGQMGTGENDKELVLGLSACIEDGVLTIESDMATHGVVVAIYDSSNALVYTSVSEIESRTHEFVVGTLPAGDYTLDVQVGDTLASGDFTIL